MDERIRVGKEEAWTSAFNQVYDKFQANQDKGQTIQLLELAWRKFRGRITQWKLTMVISTAIQNIPAKVFTDYFFSVNLHPHHRIIFHDWVKKISPDFMTGETEYFQNHEGSYYDAMSSVWKNMSVPIRIEIMCIIDRFVKRFLLVSLHGQFFFSHFFFS